MSLTNQQYRCIQCRGSITAKSVQLSLSECWFSKNHKEMLEACMLAAPVVFWQRSRECCYMAAVSSVSLQCMARRGRQIWRNRKLQPQMLLDIFKAFPAERSDTAWQEINGPWTRTCSSDSGRDRSKWIRGTSATHSVRIQVLFCPWVSLEQHIITVHTSFMHVYVEKHQTEWKAFWCECEGCPKQ